MRPGELIPLQSAPPEAGNEFFHRKIRPFLALFRVVDRLKPLTGGLRKATEYRLTRSQRRRRIGVQPISSNVAQDPFFLQRPNEK